MRKPVKGARFTSGFGMRRHPLLRYRRMHTGIDWAAPSGTPILAAGHGVGRRGRPQGRLRQVYPPAPCQRIPDHLQSSEALCPKLRKGIKVRQGQIIGYVGSTGLSSGPHLHFEVLVNNRYVNPMDHPRATRPAAQQEIACGVPERAIADRCSDAHGPGDDANGSRQSTSAVNAKKRGKKKLKARLSGRALFFCGYAAR